MLELLFLTGNRTKLAHARYMAENKPVIIESIRQRSYNATYEEPRLDVREDLLKKCHESALEQARKTNLDTKRHFFFLEDTSVRIDALSTENKEVPGVDIKYWMQSQTFETVDSLLKERGNNRKVTVRSDILLHVPDLFRNELSSGEPYLIFTGSQGGTICDKEQSIQTNLIFPWLDNKTFNKWFVPDGENVPISLLDIHSADKYDFRNKSFSQMMDFFRKSNRLVEGSRQSEMALSRSPGLIVCGFTCAGKTTIAQHLITKSDYIHIEASDFMYWNYYQRHGVNPEVKIGDFAEAALVAKPQIVAEKIAEYMEEIPDKPIIISGFRAKEEIDWLTEHYKASKEFKVAIIEAAADIRFARENLRRRERNPLTREEFDRREHQQIRMGLSDIVESPEHIKIINETTLEEFFESFEKVITSQREVRPYEKPNFSVFQKTNYDLGFEDVILLTLLSKWSSDESREYFTTTSIARMASALFPAMKPKQKDNVSRYFNQDFYPYYEILTDSEEHKRKYRLSNTGYSKAMLVYDKATQKIKKDAA